MKAQSEKKPSNRKTPYQRLLEAFQEYARGVEYRHTKIMWRYEQRRLGDGWSLVNLDQRVRAAEQLGYDVILTSDENGLTVSYRKKVPQMPWEIR